MKRSEALDVILNAYTAWLHGECGDRATRKDLAELVLSRLEGAGMMPPDRSACGCDDCGGPSYSWSDE